jgi:zinc protease
MSWTANVVKHVLPNGLTLLVQREASAPVVAVVTHVKAGYFDEPDEWVGIAHVLEHMFFKGTARRGPGEIARETQRLGGYLNASTIYDKTVYYTVLPSVGGGLERALDIQADALMHAALDATELARELEVIIQEAKRKLDHPQALASETLYELLFAVHRMRRWRIGTEAGLRRLTSADVRRYHATRYTPARTIVGVVGDLDPERATALAEATYGGWSVPSPALPPSPSEPAARHASLRVLHGDVARPLAAIGWRTVGALHPDTPALDVAAELLGAGRGSRLWRGVRLPGLGAGVSASHYTPTEVGVFELGLEAEPERVDAAVERALALTADLAVRDPDETELARVRGMLRAQWARQFESADARASALCGFEALGDHGLADRLYERTLAVSAADVRRVAGSYLTADAVCGVLYLPGERPTTLEQRWPPRASADGRQGVPELPAPAITTGRRLPAAASYPGEVAHVALPGVDLLVRPKRGAGLVSLTLCAPGLRDDERRETAGLAALLARGALRGAGGLDADALAFAAEALGGSIGAVVGADTSGWGMTVPVGAAAAAAALLRTVALEPALTEPALAGERSLLATDAARVRDDMFRYPIQQVLGVAFGDDAYGQPVLGEPAGVGRLEGAAVRALHGRMAAGRAMAVAVGDLPVEALLDVLAPLADWNAATPSVTPARPSWTAGAGAEGREKAQSALALAFPAPPATSADRLVLEVIAALLSGLGGRLFEALRERRSLAYTVIALPWVRRRAGALVAYIATSPEREAEARAGMLAELERLAREPVSEGELERARRYAAGLAVIRRQHGASVASELVDAWVSGTIAQVAAVPAALRAVTARDVARVAEAVFQVERAAEYIVRGTGGGR